MNCIDNWWIILESSTLWWWSVCGHRTLEPKGKTDRRKPWAIVCIYIWFWEFSWTLLFSWYSAPKGMCKIIPEKFYNECVTFGLILMYRVLLWMFLSCLFHMMKSENEWLELRIRENRGCYHIEAINVYIYKKENVIFLVIIHNLKIYMNMKRC